MKYTKYFLNIVICLSLGCKDNHNITSKDESDIFETSDIANEQEAREVEEEQIKNPCNGINTEGVNAKLPSKSNKAAYFIDKGIQNNGVQLSKEIKIHASKKVFEFQVVGCNRMSDDCTDKDGKLINYYTGADCGCSEIRMKMEGKEKWLPLDTDTKLENVGLKSAKIGNEEAIIFFGEEPGKQEWYRTEVALLIRIDNKKANAYVYLKILYLQKNLCSNIFKCQFYMVDEDNDETGEIMIKSKDKCIVMKQKKEQKYKWKGYIRENEKYPDYFIIAYMQMYDPNEYFGEFDTMPERTSL